MLTIESVEQKPASSLVADYRHQRDIARSALKLEQDRHSLCRIELHNTKTQLAEAQQELELAAKMLLECGAALRNLAKPD